MLLTSFDPSSGWSAPVIKPYGPLSLDPASHVLHYSSTVFEGMKAYLDPQGNPKLFRPHLNMKRIHRSIERAALPVCTLTLPIRYLMSYNRILTKMLYWSLSKNWLRLIRDGFQGVGAIAFTYGQQ